MFYSGYGGHNRYRPLSRHRRQPVSTVDAYEHHDDAFYDALLTKVMRRPTYALLALVRRRRFS